MLTPNGSTLEVTKPGIRVGRCEATETGNVASSINCESQPPMTSCRLRWRNVWGAVSEAFFVKLSDDVNNLFVEAVNLTNPIRQLAGSGQ
jgi:hypothetical protein